MSVLVLCDAKVFTTEAINLTLLPPVVPNAESVIVKAEVPSPVTLPGPVKSNISPWFTVPETAVRTDNI